MPSPDTFATIAAVVLAFGCALLTRFTEPGGLVRAPIVVLTARTVRGLCYHAAHRGRHVRRGAVVRPLSALETAPEPDETANDTSPWAVPSALATIPDPLTIARTA
jgi:hypothetical protein